MIIGTRYHEAASGVVCIFGLGLIGQAISQALQQTHGYALRAFPYSWGDRDLQKVQTKSITDAVEAAGQSAVQVVWAAGKSGFGSSHHDMDLECQEVERAFGAGGFLNNSEIGAEVSVHLISSAGALYEGQRAVHPGTPPNPTREYGHGKIMQEGILRDAVKAGRITGARLYRASTVYGYAPGGRAGLISTLVKNATLGQVTRVFGRPSTLRDYILADDIGALIARRAHEETAGAHTEFLVSGRPSSMETVANAVSRALDAKLYLKYDLETTNDAPITFAFECRPDGLVTSSLDSGIAKVARTMRGMQTRLGNNF